MGDYALFDGNLAEYVPDYLKPEPYDFPPVLLTSGSDGRVLSSVPPPSSRSSLDSHPLNLTSSMQMMFVPPTKQPGDVKTIFGSEEFARMERMRIESENCTVDASATATATEGDDVASVFDNGTPPPTVYEVSNGGAVYISHSGNLQVRTTTIPCVYARFGIYDDTR